MDKAALLEIAVAILAATGAKKIADIEDVSQRQFATVAAALLPFLGDKTICHVKATHDAMLLLGNKNPGRDDLPGHALIEAAILLEGFIATGKAATIEDAIARAEWGADEIESVGDTGDDVGLLRTIAADLRLYRDFGDEYLSDNPATTFAGWHATQS